MKVLPAGLPGVVIVEPAAYGDERGSFMELWQQERYAAAGLPARFVQDNLVYSRRGVLRGLHYQHPNGQGKLVAVVSGEIYDVAVDMRPGSPWFGHWTGEVLSAENRRQIYIPPGFAHGYLVLSAEAVVLYKCTEFWRPDCERGVRWDDPDIGISWPAEPEILARRDLEWPRLQDIPAEHLPPYREDDSL